MHHECCVMEMDGLVCEDHMLTIWWLEYLLHGLPLREMLGAPPLIMWKGQM